MAADTPSAARPPDQGQQRALGEQLRDQPAAARSYRQPDGDLLAPRAATRNQQSGDVRASHQQHQARNRHQHHQRPRELPFQTPAAARGGHHLERHRQKAVASVLAGLGELLGLDFHAQNLLEQRLHPRLGLRDAHPRLQPPKDVHPAGSPVVEHLPIPASSPPCIVNGTRMCWENPGSIPSKPFSLTPITVSG